MNDQLSTPELAVLDRVSRGMSNAQAGRSLYISEDTVKSHLRKVFRKLGVADRAAAVRVGFERGLLRPRRGSVLASMLPDGVFTEATPRRPMADAHIAACFAAEGCPCRGGATWRWHTPDEAGSVNGDG